MQKVQRTCVSCNKILVTRHQVKFCSNKCQQNYKYNIFLNDWKKGLVSGEIGRNVKAVSAHLRKYLLNKYDEKCSLCGWNKKHNLTGKVPIEIDHIDGDSENNTEINLRLLCPNCHSLTPYFRNLNKGHGRRWRMEKINKEIKHIPF